MEYKLPLGSYTSDSQEPNSKCNQLEPRHALPKSFLTTANSRNQASEIGENSTFRTLLRCIICRNFFESPVCLWIRTPHCWHDCKALAAPWRRSTKVIEPRQSRVQRLEQRRTIIPRAQRRHHPNAGELLDTRRFKCCARSIHPTQWRHHLLPGEEQLYTGRVLRVISNNYLSWILTLSQLVATEQSSSSVDVLTFVVVLIIAIVLLVLAFSV